MKIAYQGVTVNQYTMKQDAESDLTVFLREIGQIPLLSRAEQAELTRRARAGDEEARQKMIRGNLRLVVKVAADMAYCGLPLADRISEGSLGLMKAVDRFKPALGAFSTYATWWIRQGIQRAAANQARTVRLPVHMGEKLMAMHRAEARLHETLGRPPGVDELAKELKTSSAKVVSMQKLCVAPTSLDAPIEGMDNDHCVGDFVTDETAEDPFENTARNFDFERLHAKLALLSPPDRAALIERFGLQERYPDLTIARNTPRETTVGRQRRALARLRSAYRSDLATCVAA